MVPKEFRMHSSNKAAWCFPDWHRPFETLENGDHFYAMYEPLTQIGGLGFRVPNDGHPAFFQQIVFVVRTF